MDPEEEGEEFEDFTETEEGFEGEPEEETLEEAAPEGEEPEEPEPSRRPSRARTRIEALDREVREAREREEAWKREREQLLAGQSRTSAEQRDREERERLAQMDPLERAEYLARATGQRVDQQIGALSRQIADSSDRAAFAEACAANPALAKVKDEVETELAKLRQGNVNMPRETLAAYLIGKSALSKAPKARASAAKRAAANLDRERARPAGGASDAPSRGRETDDKAARDKRLEGYAF